LTLILVPVMYSLVDDVTTFFRRHYTYGDTEGRAGSGPGGETGDDGWREGLAGSPDPSPGETQREPAEVYREGLFGKPPLPQSE